MTTKKSSLKELDITIGVQPITDKTRLNTKHYTYSDKIRSWHGSPQVIGGWSSVDFTYDKTIEGYARSMYGDIIQNQNLTMIGTHSNLYHLIGQTLTNVTPLKTTTNAIPDSLDTDYDTLGSDPITTTSGSNYIVVSDTNAAYYRAGDLYTLSGATSVNGVADTSINAQHTIRSTGTNTVTLYVADTATGSGSGGGAAVDRATGRITVNAAAHGQSEYGRVKINDAATTGGIADALINAEFQIRNIDTNVFDIFTTGTATSSVSGGGGGSTTYQTQIDAGNENESLGVGWGVGLWGVGLWGVSGTSTSGRSYPRIWFFDRFGDSVIMTAGNESGIYTWQGDTSEAPTLIANAPTDINYAFVSDNTLITFGYDGIPNQIFASDQGDPTEWTASSLNQVYQDVIEGAGRLVSHCPVLSTNLLFTQNQTYRFTKVDISAGVWEIKQVDNSVGIIAPLARVSVNDIAYWMGRHNFYMWSGGAIETIPSNSEAQCTAINYVFNDLNEGQLSKIFAWYNANFQEIWFHYPSSGSEECDRVVRVSILDNSWWIDTFDRTCAEMPQQIMGYPRMIASDGTFYEHEIGDEADGEPLVWSITSNMMMNGKKSQFVTGIVPDSNQENDITFTFTGYQFPQSQTPIDTKSYTVSNTTERVPAQCAGRFWTYSWAGTGAWDMGLWFEYIQEGPEN